MAQPASYGVGTAHYMNIVTLNAKELAKHYPPKVQEKVHAALAKFFATLSELNVREDGNG
jgi:hypothetical protein